MTVPDAQSHQQAAHERVHGALGLIKRTKPRQSLILVDVSNALDALCQAAVISPDLAQLGAELAQAMHEALFGIAPALAEAVADDITAEDIYFMLGNASGLLTVGRDEFHHDRLNYSCILSARLKLAFHDRDLRGRGFPLAHALHMKRLMDTPRLPSDPVH